MEPTNSMNSKPPTPPPYSGQNGGCPVSDILIFIVIAYMLFYSIVTFLLSKLYPEWYDSIARYLYFALNIIWAAGPVILGIALRNKILKIIGIIMGGLYAVYIIANNIISIIQYLRY
jgi:hypothetical protein